MEETEEKKKEKDTEKKEKKTKKKSKDSVDAPKTNKTTKQERKSNKTNSHFHSKSFASNKKKPTSIKLKLYANVCSFTEKNLQEALTSEAVSAEVSPEKTKQDQSEAEQEEEEEEEDGLQRNASQTPKRKKDLDTCERKICSA